MLQTKTEYLDDIIPPLYDECTCLSAAYREGATVDNFITILSITGSYIVHKYVNGVGFVKITYYH